MSRFSEVKLGPPIEVFALNKAYAEDNFENKVNLGVGGNQFNILLREVYQSNNYLAYRTDKGQPWVLPVVRTAEKELAQDETLNKEYLPVLGLEAFTNVATKMLLGEDSPAIVENRVSKLSL